jgi:hypothetical protein
MYLRLSRSRVLTLHGDKNHLRSRRPWRSSTPSSLVTPRSLPSMALVPAKDPFRTVGRDSLGCHSPQLLTSSRGSDPNHPQQDSAQRQQAHLQRGQLPVVRLCVATLHCEACAMLTGQLPRIATISNKVTLSCLSWPRTARAARCLSHFLASCRRRYVGRLLCPN